MRLLGGRDEDGGHRRPESGTAGAAHGGAVEPQPFGASLDEGPVTGLKGGLTPRGRRFVMVLPYLLLVAGAIYDILTPAPFTALPMFTAAPLIAAPIYSRRGTLITGIAVSTTVLLLRLFSSGLGGPEGETDLVTVLTVSALSLLVNMVVRRSGAQLASAREIAEAAQRAVLPDPVDQLDGLDIAVRYEAAQAGAFIGGDLYAVQDTPYGVRLIVGDVRGKGMGAVATVAVLLGAFREAAEQEVTLEAVGRRLEHALVRDGAVRRDIDNFEGFTTAVLAEIVHEGRAVRLLNRGHPGPLLLAPDGSVRVLEASRAALPIGLAAIEAEATADRTDLVTFPTGATLLFHTDGLLEARDESGTFYDPVGALTGRAFPAPGHLLTWLVDEVREYTGGGSSDDMALLAVRRPDGSGSSAPDGAHAARPADPGTHDPRAPDPGAEGSRTDPGGKIPHAPQGNPTESGFRHLE